jgi:hypothetical protein
VSTRLAVVCLVLAAGLGGGVPLGAEELPAWLQSAIAATAPSYDKDIHGVVLHDEGTATVGPDGRVTRLGRYAVRILDRDGASLAAVRVGYDTDSSKVRDLRAWLVASDGTVKRYDGKETADIAMVANDVYSEARAKLIDASGSAVGVAVFAYESAVEEKAFFAGEAWAFQGRLPVLRSRYTLILPAGWRAEGNVFNHAAMAPLVSGSQYTWELQDLAPIKDEPWAPGLESLAPSLLVRYGPSAGGPAGESATFADWTSVSRWYAALAEPQATPSDALAAKARELVKDADGEWQQIARVGRFVQSINYISIQIGMGRYRPHPAGDVLAKSYGDCKDKANLMLALLRTLGVRAHLVLVDALDADSVHPEWPSPAQFNHVIVAIETKTAPPGAATVEHPRLGALLLFDPTAPHTRLGDLPGAEQGGWGLLAAGEAGGLVRLPLLPPSARRIERRLEAALGADGGVNAEVDETSWGQSAVDERRALNGEAGAFTRRIEQWLASGIRAARTTAIEPSDGDDRLSLKMRFSSPSYGQVMQGRLLVFCPALLSRRDFVALNEAVRQTPIRVRASEFTEIARVALPAGFAVDDLPPAVTLDAPFGSYRFAIETHADHLIVRRQLTTARALVPAAEYKAVRQFFEKVAAAEQSRVVLVKQ